MCLNPKGGSHRVLLHSDGWHSSEGKQEQNLGVVIVRFADAVLRFPTVQLREILFSLLNLDSFMQSCCNH